MGSGHILAYAFDLLMDIYRASGRDDRSAVESIITHNLYGLEIDERAAQLAYFEVMMKGREYDRRFFRNHLEPHTCVITESNGLDTSLVDAVFDKEKDLKKDMVSIMEDMKDGKTYGSLIHVRKVDFEGLKKYLQQELESGSFYGEVIKKELLPLVECAEILGSQMLSTSTNPPFVGSKGMDNKLTSYIKKNYSDGKSDLYSCFIERCHEFTQKNGYQAMITQHGWMFLTSFERLRAKILSNNVIIDMAHLGARAFDEIGGEVVQTVAFVMFKCNLLSAYLGTYKRLINSVGEKEKELSFFDSKNNFYCSSISYRKIPGAPIAYWSSNNIIQAFQRLSPLSDIAQPRQGVKTLNNDLFLKLWYEVYFMNIGFNCTSIEESILSRHRWFPYNKGGTYRKWYGNNDYVVDWFDDGKAMKKLAIEKYHSVTRTITNISYFFKKGLTWSSLSTGNISLRAFGVGYIFDSKGSSMYFSDDDLMFYILAFMNTKVSMKFLEFLSPTLDFNSGPISKIPVKIDRDKIKDINALVTDNIDLSKADWDAFETSWDFQRHPLVRSVGTVEEAFSQWKEECENRFQKLKANEEELNRIFIHIYGLEDELTPEEEDKDVTVRKADLGRDIRSLISYGAGCILGRYSLDTPGLAYAGGEWDSTKYKTFHPDEDNIIPITDEAYFDDDMVGRFTDWLSAVYGKDTLQENLKFIAEALGKKGDSPREALRKYFLTDFFKDHCKTYQKRPIYWLFDSGKKNGFKALIYLHRYDKDTMSRMRNRYLHRMEKIYQQRIEECRNTIAADPLLTGGGEGEKGAGKIHRPAPGMPGLR